MVSSTATTVGEYLAGLPVARRAVIRGVRDIIRRHIPKGYREAIGFGMITYQVPLSRYPDTYNGRPLMYVGLAAQKNAFSLYLTCAYMDEDRARRLREAFRRAGKKIDMGKSCIRFRSLEDLELEAVAAEIASTPPDEFIRRYEKSRA
jgi:hypothetical protein